MPDDTLKIRIANLALSRIGHTEGLAGLDEDSTEGRAASAAIDHVLRATLREHPWGFATKYADPMTVVAGAALTPVNRDWTFAYAYPSDCLFVRRLLTASRRDFNADPLSYRVGREVDQLVVYTDEPDAGIEYTAIFDCPLELADELFVDACAWRMASELAPSLSRNKLTTREAYAMYLGTLNRAAAVTEREQQQPPDGEAEWIRGR
jgi:hypothetical protein